MSTTRGYTRYKDGQKARALFLRSEGKSISVISDELGIPESTIGDWVRGVGEPAMIKTCWCGERFIARRRDQFGCSSAHTHKHYRLYGAIPMDVRRAVS